MDMKPGATARRGTYFISLDVHLCSTFLEIGQLRCEVGSTSFRVVLVERSKCREVLIAVEPLVSSSVLS